MSVLLPLLLGAEVIDHRHCRGVKACSQHSGERSGGDEPGNRTNKARFAQQFVKFSFSHLPHFLTQALRSFDCFCSWGKFTPRGKSSIFKDASKSKS